MTDLNNHPDVFLFYKCCKSLECVSVRNLKEVDGATVTQTALMKFIRNEPLTLKWFQSDITIENMDVLRPERPGIKLLN